MDKDVSEKQGGRVIPWKTVSISSVIASIPLMIGINQAYVGWHDDHNDQRYASKEQVLLAQNTAAENSSKLDNLSVQLSYLEVQAAVSVVNAFQQEYDRWLRDPENTKDWLAERDRLARQMKTAEQYRDCLMERHNNCDALRRW